MFEKRENNRKIRKEKTLISFSLHFSFISILKIATTEVAKMVSRAWKAMDENEREKWEEMARRDKARFLLEKQMYKGPWKIPISAKGNRDPNAPKRPMSAFLSYSNKKRGAMKRLHPNISNSDISRLLSKMWKEAPQEERKTYIETEFKLRQAYKKKMAEFKKKTGDERDAVRDRREADALRLIDSGRFNCKDLEEAGNKKVVDVIPLVKPFEDRDFGCQDQHVYGHHSPVPMPDADKNDNGQSWVSPGGSSWSTESTHGQSYSNEHHAGSGSYEDESIVSYSTLQTAYSTPSSKEGYQSGHHSHQSYYPQHPPQYPHYGSQQQYVDFHSGFMPPPAPSLYPSEYSSSEVNMSVNPSPYYYNSNCANHEYY